MNAITLKEVLENLPPGYYENVQAVLKWATKGWSDDKVITLQSPDLELHCDNERCNGVRLFEYTTNPYVDNIVEIGDNRSCYSHCYVEYECQNCKKNFKGFFLILFFEDNNIDNVDVVKVGEYPFYGPPVPSRLITLIGPDRELFLKGRKCESQGLGIAAFTYYRRVIEDQKDRLIDRIILVIEKLNNDPSLIVKLTQAKDEIQFTTAVQKIKNYIPESLYIQGYNPLSLLHKVLSIGVHNLTDEECLAHAYSVRVVLTELANRLSEVLKDHSEIVKAIKNLNKL